MEDKSCKTPRWRMLKSKLNNLAPLDFYQKAMSNDENQIIDVLTKEEYATGHIKGGVNICYLEDDFWDRIESLSKEKPVFVYCRTGRRSVRACTLMRNGGFDPSKVYNLDGGYKQYLRTIAT